MFAFFEKKRLIGTAQWSWTDSYHLIEDNPSQSAREHEYSSLDESAHTVARESLPT